MTPLDINLTNSELETYALVLAIVLLIIVILAFVTGRWRP